MTTRSKAKAVSRAQNCSLCHRPGHSRDACPANLMEPGPRRLYINSGQRQRVEQMRRALGEPSRG